LVVLVALAIGVFAGAASADPTQAKNSLTISAMCGTQPVMVVVNGNGTYNAAHVIGSTAVFVPTAFDLMSSFTPTGGTTMTMTNTNTKQNQSKGTVTCDIPMDLNTFTSPQGTFSLSGSVTGFFTPANG
jgi:hypothetical protein